MPRGGTSPRTCSLGAVWAQLFMGGERLPWAHSHQDTTISFQARGGGSQSPAVLKTDLCRRTSGTTLSRSQSVSVIWQGTELIPPTMCRTEPIREGCCGSEPMKGVSKRAVRAEKEQWTYQGGRRGRKKMAAVGRLGGEVSEESRAVSPKGICLHFFSFNMRSSS